METFIDIHGVIGARTAKKGSDMWNEGPAEGVEEEGVGRVGCGEKSRRRARARYMERYVERRGGRGAGVGWKRTPPPRGRPLKNGLAREAQCI